MAQCVSKVPAKIFKTRISLQGNGRKITGVIYDISLSSVMVARTTKKKDLCMGSFDLTTVNAYDISEIRIGKKFIKWENAGMGCLGGLIAGGACGFTNALYHTYNFNDILSTTFTCSIVGAALGALLGAFLPARIKISINGDLRHFAQHSEDLRKYSIK